MGNNSSTESTDTGPSTLQDLVDIVKETISKDTASPFSCIDKKKQLTSLDQENYRLIVEGVYISGEEFAISVNYLQELGINHVLNVAEGTPGQAFAHTKDNSHIYINTGIAYKGVKAEDVSTYNLKQHFEECNNFIHNAIKAGGKVLVHCLIGYSRSPTIVAAYLMAKKGMSAKKALKCIKERKEINPNKGFLQQLCEYEQELGSQGVNSSPAVTPNEEAVSKRGSSRQKPAAQRKTSDKKSGSERK